MKLLLSAVAFAAMASAQTSAWVTLSPVDSVNCTVALLAAPTVPCYENTVGADGERQVLVIRQMMQNPYVDAFTLSLTYRTAGGEVRNRWVIVPVIRFGYTQAYGIHALPHGETFVSATATVLVRGQ